MANKVLEVEFRGKDAITADLKKMGATAEQTARKLKEVEDAQSNRNRRSMSLGDRIDTRAKALENSFGEDRNVNKLLQGGLVGFTGEMLGSAIAKMVEFKNAIKSGEESAASLTQKFLEAVPIIGGFATAGKNIRELFTGEQADLDQLNASIKLQNTLIEFQQGLLDGQKKRWEAIGDVMKGINRRSAVMGLEGPDKDSAERGFAAQDRVGDIRKKAQAEADAVAKAQKDSLAKIRDDAKAGNVPSEELWKRTRQVNEKAQKETARINQQWDRVEAAERNLTFQEEARARGKALDEAKEAQQKYHEEVRDIEAAMRAERLRAMGRDLDAELLLIDQQAEKKKKAIEKQLEADRKKAPPERRGELDEAARQQAAAVDAAAAQQKQAAAQRDRKERADRRREITSGLRREQEEILSIQAETAKGTEKVEAKKRLEAFRLQSEFAERQQRLQKVLADPAATDQQKQVAQRQMTTWLGTVGDQFNAATKTERTPLSHVASLEESRTLTGVSAAAKERGDVPAEKTAKNTEEANKLQKQLNDQFAAYVRWVQSQKAGGGGLVLGVSE